MSVHCCPSYPCPICQPPVVALSRIVTEYEPETNPEHAVAEIQRIAQRALKAATGSFPWRLRVYSGSHDIITEYVVWAPDADKAWHLLWAHPDVFIPYARRYPA